jgi:hypothetical protein
MDILAQTVRKEGILALYKGSPRRAFFVTYPPSLTDSDCKKGWPVPSSGSQASTLCSSPLTESRNGSFRRSDSSLFRRPPRRALWLAPQMLFLPVRWKCSRCACRASTETRRTSGCASSLERCGRSGVFGRGSCAGIGYAIFVRLTVDVPVSRVCARSPWQEKFQLMQGEAYGCSPTGHIDV